MTPSLGVAAAATFAELAASAYESGDTVQGRLAAINKATGFHVANNGYLVVPDPAVVDTIFQRIRNEGHYWLRVGSWHIEHIRDLTQPGLDTSKADGVPDMPVVTDNMITFKFAAGATLTLRPSGTEPKLKFYSEMVDADAGAAATKLGALLSAVVEEMIQPSKHGIAWDPK